MNLRRTSAANANLMWLIFGGAFLLGILYLGLEVTSR
jgi:hypothetical protein